MFRVTGSIAWVYTTGEHAVETRGYRERKHALVTARREREHATETGEQG